MTNLVAHLRYTVYQRGGAYADTVARSSMSANYYLDQVPDPSFGDLVIKALRSGSLEENSVSGPNLLVPLGKDTLDAFDNNAKKRIHH